MNRDLASTPLWTPTAAQRPCRVLKRYKQAQNLLMDLREHGRRFRFLVRDRAGQSTEAFDAVLTGAGIEVVQIPSRGPRANAYAERWVRTVRAEVTDRMLMCGQCHQRAVLNEYTPDYSRHRPHRALTLRPPDCDVSTPAAIPGLTSASMRRRRVPGEPSTTTSGQHDRHRPSGDVAGQRP